ncbi:MAG: transposase [Rickettsiales bacterium]|nr:transposase [Rickettsiales bacterium]
MPSYWQHIILLVMFILKNSDSYDKCYYWLQNNYSFNIVDEMTSQKLSNLLHIITEKEKNMFYRLWYKTLDEDEYINIDLTSLPTYSQQMYFAEYGRPKQQLDKKIKQINLCLFFGQKSFTPIYQQVYNGSLHDSITLRYTVTKFTDIVGDKKCLFIMDRGFYSSPKLSILDKEGINYLCSVPFTNLWTKSEIDKVRNKIQSPANTIMTNDCDKVIVGSHINKDIDSNNKDVNIHIYYDAESYLEEQNKIYLKIHRISKMIIEGEDTSEHDQFIENYMIIHKSRGKNGKISIVIHDEKVNKYLKYKGWFIYVSNCIDDPQKAYDLYHNRDMVEIGFFKYKNVLNIDRLEVHSDINANNKLFIGFLSLIMDRYITISLRNNKIIQRYNLDKILRIMDTIKCYENDNGQLVISPLTKEQIKIFSEFHIDPPEFNFKWDKKFFHKYFVTQLHKK